MNKHNVLRKGLVCGIIILFIGVSVVPSINGNIGGPICIEDLDYVESKKLVVTTKDISDVIIVDDEGDGDFECIQDAIEYAYPGSTIEVYSGTYKENLVVEIQQLTLKGIPQELGVGSDTGKPVIEGVVTGYSGNSVVSVSAEEVHINGFIIKKKNIGISMGDSSNCIISNNTFLNNGLFVSNSYQNTVFNNTVNGKPLVYLEEESNKVIDDGAGQVILISCDNITIQDQELSYTTVGIELWDTHNCLILGNTINSNKHDSVLLKHSTNNTILDNNILNNDCDGISLSHSSSNNILNNSISSRRSAGLSGILLKTSSNNTIAGNAIVDNWQGIEIWTSRNTIYDNVISNNLRGMYLAFNSKNNLLYHNDFIDNSENAWDEGSNIWDNDYPSGGNYWDDYTGTDSDGDGIGDTPYNILSGDNLDRYPLMTTWGKSEPPEKPARPSGPAAGKPRTTYTYATDTTDPDGELMRYLFDWGDRTSTWTDYYTSGETAETSHKWWIRGNYTIKVKARDIYGYESEWSDPLSVTMPRNRIVNRSFLNFLQQHPILFQILSRIIGGNTI